MQFAECGADAPEPYCGRPDQVAASATEIVKIPNRGHSLTIDHCWREVAQTALDFVKRFA